MNPTPEILTQQIETAFHYRGHVTCTLHDGKTVEGYLYNRVLTSERPFVELFLAGTGDPHKLWIEEIQSVALTGKDEASGKSYQNWLDKQAAKGGSQ
jgi:hypothetical protein